MSYKPATDCLLPYNNAVIISKVSEEVNHINSRKLLSSTTPQSFDAPYSRNPSTYLQCIYFIFLDMESSIYIFVVGSVKCIFFARVHFGCSRSSKIIDFCVNWKRICNFLLMHHSNLGPILHHFRDIAVFCTPPHSTLILWVFPFDQITYAGVSQSINLKLIRREIIIYFQSIPTYVIMVPECHRWIDRQTTYCGITALCTASRCKKTLNWVATKLEHPSHWVTNGAKKTNAIEEIPT